MNGNWKRTAKRSQRFCLIGMLLVIPQGLWSAPFDSAAYRQILKNYRTMVGDASSSYAGVAYYDPGLRTLSAQAMKDVETYRGSNPLEWKAFYINAYNIAVIDLVARNWPVKTILRVEGGKAFTNPRLVLHGKRISLDDLEKRILQPAKDPRIHFALVCAARGCPDLRKEPYMPHMLDRQLDDQARSFLHSSRGAVLKGNTLHLSKLFEWYRQDFGDLRSFIGRYRKLPASVSLVADLEYDWRVNVGGPNP